MKEQIILLLIFYKLIIAAKYFYNKTIDYKREFDYFGPVFDCFFDAYPNREDINFYFFEVDDSLSKMCYFLKINGETDEIISKGSCGKVKSLPFFMRITDKMNISLFLSYFLKQENGNDSKFNFDGSISKFEFYPSYFWIGCREANKSQIIFSNYPYDSYSTFIFDCPVSPSVYFWINLKDAFILILSSDKVSYSYKIINKEFNEIKTKEMIFGDVIIFRSSTLSENELSNEFINCFMYKTKSICKIVKYENSDLTFGKDFEVFSDLKCGDQCWKCYYFFLYLYSNSRFLLSAYCQEEFFSTRYITILKYSNSKLEIHNNIKNYVIYENPDLLPTKAIGFRDLIFTRLFENNKGLKLITVENNNIYIYYFTANCQSKRISFISNKLSKFKIEEIINEGIEDKFTFSFPKIDNNLVILKNSVKVKENEIFEDTNNFEYLLTINNIIDNLYTIYHLLIEINGNGVACDIEIEMKTEIIKVYNSLYKCIPNESLSRINNINTCNLNETFIIDDKKYIELLINFKDDTPKENELIYYYNDYRILCKALKKTAYCQIPTRFIEKYKKNYLYSKLSCLNKISIGWFRITDKYIEDVYDLKTSDSYIEAKKLYDPSEIITEFNEDMINYYYWFSCFAYCDDELMENKIVIDKRCCPDILQDWEIIYHKEYITKITLIDYLNTLLKSAKDSFSFKGLAPHFNSLKFKLELLGGSVMNFLIDNTYLYNFVVLKSDAYKKIIVGFPGTTNIFQFFHEVIDSFMIYINDQYYDKHRASKMFYDTFNLISEDFYNILYKTPEFNDPQYQTIFIGHSLGGALATISSYFYIRNGRFKSKPILITFGQPRVGDENFAKYLTSKIKNIYRIARLKDVVTLIPLKEDFLTLEQKNNISLITILMKIIRVFNDDNFISIFSSLFDLMDKLIKKYESSFHYCHIGGLYMINDKEKKIYQCKDFFNEDTNHFICRNTDAFDVLKEYKYGVLIFHGYLSIGQKLMSGCQEGKDITILPPKRLISLYQNNICNYQIYNFVLKNNLLKRNNLPVFTLLFSYIELYIEENISEIWLEYKQEEYSDYDKLFLRINQKNSLFFGVICISQNMLSLINEDDSIICHYIKERNAFTIKIDIFEEKDNSIYFHLKGKISGYIELLDLTKTKILDINESYYFPPIDNISSRSNIMLSIPPISDYIYVNLLIKNNSCSLLEIYKDNKKVDCNNELPDLFILDKNCKYYFRYYPENKNELFINFKNVYLNDFLEKTLYILNNKNLYFNYIMTNNITALFFDLNGKIKIEGHFSNNEIYDNNSSSYIINTNEKYFMVNKNNKYRFLNIKLYIYYKYLNEFKIYEIHEIINISKINNSYNIKKGKNILFVFDSNIINKYLIFDSFILLSIKNQNNIIKIINYDNYIITSKNILFSSLFNIKGIFIYSNEDDIFEIQLIPEKISKNIDEDISLIENNIFIENKKISFEYIHNDDSRLLFYSSLFDNNNLKLYKIDDNFNLENIINNKISNYSILSGIYNLEKYNTFVLLKYCNNDCMYMKYNDKYLNFEYILDNSKMLYLFMDFKYTAFYNKNLTKILVNIISSDSNSIEINCEKENMQIKSSYEVLDIEKCNGEFSVKGNNSLLFFSLPLTSSKDFIIINNTKSFELNNINEFFFIPDENNYNLINIFFSRNDYVNETILLTYYIEYGIIPYSKNIQKKTIAFKDTAYIEIINYKQNFSENEMHFIYFYFDDVISNLKANIIYENAITLEEGNSLIIPSGINQIKLGMSKNNYINITKINNESPFVYSIFRNGKCNENESNIRLAKNSFYFNKSKHDEIIKLKIENEEDILLSMSRDYFDDLSMIINDKTISINQNETILNIKFNATSYESKIEYYIAINESNKEINNTILIHKIINENLFIYNTIINSLGNEQISIDINIEKYFKYNKFYKLIILGKEIFETSFNYIYYEQKSFMITKNDEKNK